MAACFGGVGGSRNIDDHIVPQIAHVWSFHTIFAAVISSLVLSNPK